MKGTAWNETEVKAAVAAYFRILDAQEDGRPVKKAATYSALAAAFPSRSAKAFELKFQNISAILYEERHPFVDGLLPRGNYQNLLKLIVWDHLRRGGPPARMPWDILVDRLRRLYARGPLTVRGSGTGRFGLTLEHNLGIPPNSSKVADFMGIELKTKLGGPLQTLFSRVPSRFGACASRAELLNRYGRPNKKTGRLDLYTSFNRDPDSFGFRLSDSGEEVQVRNGEEVVLGYAYEDLESCLLSKHAETAYVAVETFGATCQFPAVLYCKGPSMLRFLRLLRAGHVNLDFTLSANGQGAKDHGFLWRIAQAHIHHLYVSNSGQIDFRRRTDAAS